MVTELMIHDRAAADLLVPDPGGVPLVGVGVVSVLLELHTVLRDVAHLNAWLGEKTAKA